MKANMGKTDKLIRIILAIVFILLNVFHVVGGMVGNVLLILAIVFLLTSAIGFCPLYLPFNINTKEKENKQ